MNTSDIIVAETLPSNGLIPPTRSLALQGPGVALTKSLAKAQRAARAVPKDSRNEFHKYNYASAEAVIQAAREALGAADLVLIPLEQTVDGSAREGDSRYELRTRFLLLDPSGECLELRRTWPICVEKGRPLDKATAISATLTLSYLLRDLLMLPRVDAEDDLAAQKDHPVPVAEEANMPISDAQYQELVQLCRQHGRDQEFVQEMIARCGVKVLTKMPQRYFEWCKQFLTTPPDKPAEKVSEAQLARIGTLAGEVLSDPISVTKFQEWRDKKFQGRKGQNLLASDAAEIIQALEAKKARMMGGVS
jgi:ERF superfamily